jgi:predicted TPR repeat methyltransferase
LLELNLIPTSPKIVDVATGTGLLAQAFKNTNPAAYITGIDFSLAILNQAMEKRVLDKYVVQNILSTWVDTRCATQDVVAGTGIVEYLSSDDLDIIITNAHRALKQGGVFAASYYGMKESQDTASGQNKHDAAEISKKITETGFEIRHHKPFNAYRRQSGEIVRQRLVIGQKM